MNIAPVGVMRRSSEKLCSVMAVVPRSVERQIWSAPLAQSSGFRTRSSRAPDDVRNPLDDATAGAHLPAMDLDHAACYSAISLRDSRFDGRFFTGVRTTGIYCRPICPARTPRRENVTFFASASAAQEAGFRPCLRCRPESSPDLAAWRGTSNTVSRALALIAEGALDDGAVDELA